MILLGASTVALILLIWFRSEAWLEYTKLFHLNFLSFYKDYELKKKDDVSLEYLVYLRRYHNCFLIRLVTCPICLSIWIGLAFCIFTFPFQFPVVVVGGLLLFKLIDNLIG
jgi:hypothetical protein